MYNISILDINNEEMQAYIEGLNGTNDPLQLVTPELFNMANNDADSEDSEDHLIVDVDGQLEDDNSETEEAVDQTGDINEQMENADEDTRTSPQY